MIELLRQALEGTKKVIVIQAENPDGDSLGSALGLEEILGDLGKEVSLYCAVAMPKHLRYLAAWSRVNADFDLSADAAIIVDTLSDTLLSKLVETPGARHWLDTHPVVAIDHHASVEDSLSFKHETILDGKAVATGEAIVNLCEEAKWSINAQAATYLFSSIMSDSLGLSTEATTSNSIRTIATLVDYGAKPSIIEAARRELMKKSPEILAYKGKLIERIEYLIDGQLAIIHIPWEDIQAYSDQYNPSILVLDEMRLVEGVKIAIAIKTYPDGRVTGKLRANVPVADVVAGYFGGGGHPYSSGFRAHEEYDQIIKELVTATQKALEQYETDHASV